MPFQGSGVQGGIQSSGQGSVCEHSKTIPQRLKPGRFAEFSGTTEVVPFQRSGVQGGIQSSGQGSVRERSRTIPQRLKPGQFAQFSGTTEVMPFQGNGIQSGSKGRGSKGGIQSIIQGSSSRGSGFFAARRASINFASLPSRLKACPFRAVAWRLDLALAGGLVWRGAIRFGLGDSRGRAGQAGGRS